MSPKMWETCGKVILRKMPLSYLRGIFLRCLAESNRCSRFCRPVPNRSAKAPFPYWDCKYTHLFWICNLFDKYICIKQENLFLMHDTVESIPKPLSIRHLAVQGRVFPFHPSHSYLSDWQIVTTIYDRFPSPCYYMAYQICTPKARGRRSKPLGVACAAWLERLARRICQPRCVHTDYAIPICYTLHFTNHVAPKPLSTKTLLKVDSPSAEAAEKGAQIITLWESRN